MYFLLIMSYRNLLELEAWTLTDLMQCDVTPVVSHASQQQISSWSSWTAKAWSGQFVSRETTAFLEFSVVIISVRGVV